jgi:hypothetical protein
LARESDEAQFQATGHRLFRFKVDGHPNRSRVKWKKAVEPDCGLQANDALGYALTREHYLALKVRGKKPLISTLTVNHSFALTHTFHLFAVIVALALSSQNSKVPQL